MLNRKPTGRTYHRYLNPQREIDAEAIEVHGITNDFLADKPLFREVMEEFKAFIAGAELIIHNAPFDVGFINHEFALAGPNNGSVQEICTILDTLVMARQIYPGQKNNLDALCKRLYIDNSQRTLHGALLDSEILAEVYLLMTGGQTSLSLGAGADGSDAPTPVQRVAPGQYRLAVLEAGADELAAHEKMLDRIDKRSGGSVWRRVPAG